MDRIEFLEPRRVGDIYLQCAHMGHASACFRLRGVRVSRGVHLQGRRYFMEIEFSDKIAGLFARLRQFTIDYVRATKAEDQDQVEKAFVDKVDDNHLLVEVHPECAFLVRGPDGPEPDSWSSASGTVDVALVYTGIMYSADQFSIKYTVHECIRDWAPELSSDDDCSVLDYDEVRYLSKYHFDE